MAPLSRCFSPALAQLWLRVWDPETFIKLMITDGVLLVVALVWAMIQGERRETARLRDRNRLGE